MAAILSPEAVYWLPTPQSSGEIAMSTRPLAVSLMALSALATVSLAEDHSKLRQPTLTPQVSGTTQGLIAVSPVNSRVVWASGRGGTFVVTTDGGQTWRAGVVPGAESLQFRDVQGVSDTVAYLLSIGNGTDARIYKTTDGGATWTMQFQNQDPSAFYDCFAFWTPRRGIAQSDSVNGRFPVIRTTDGKAWPDIGDNLPPALDGESSFASSGTCVAAQGKNNAWIVTGGASRSRVLATRDGGETWNAYDSPLRGSPRRVARDHRRRRSRPIGPAVRPDRDLERRRRDLDDHETAAERGHGVRLELCG